ncbi:hypothetical protein ABGB17_36050 [Sphaerisporangium sp. B11E5]|uniref:hypothetical protein n=1 Tax=Sphaerisporangium sp. B11E5 TaxID=3153563 RepID=UPI00325CEFCB
MTPATGPDPAGAVRAPAAPELRAAWAYPHEWRDAAGVSLLAEESWHRATAGRLEGRPVWLWLTGRRARTGLDGHEVRAGHGADEVAAGPGERDLRGGPGRHEVTAGPGGQDVRGGPGGREVTAGPGGQDVRGGPGGREVTAGLAGVVVGDPDAYTFGNLRLLLADAAAPFAPPGAVPGEAAAVAGELFPNLFLSYPGYATFPVGARRDDPAVVGALLDAVVAWAADAGTRAVALPYTEAGGVLAGVARAAGFTAIPLTSDSYVDVPPGGFPAYLAALPAHRRRRVAAERRRLHASGLRGRLVEHVDACLLERVVALRVRQRARYGLPADPAAEHARLSRLLAAMGDRATVVIVGEPDAPVCFTLQAKDGDTWHEICSGTDYDDPRSRTAYFEAVFYTPIEYAPGRGVRRISYGLGAE